MARNSVRMLRTASASLGVGQVTADSTRPRRGKLYDLICSQAEATPADGATRFEVNRCTAAGTSTGVTPQKLDPASATTEMDAGENQTIVSTNTAGEIPLTIGLNQRATFRWVAAPYAELVYPATNLNGFGIRTIVATALAVDAVALVEEQ